MKITDRYIDRDWSVIWQANAKVLGLLDWSELKKREENDICRLLHLLVWPL